MKINQLIQKLMPRQERFHELFAAATHNLVAAAAAFGDIARTPSLEQRRIKAVELKALEHDGDQITRKIFEALNSTFITPLDREDIRSIATDLDDILDYLEGVAQHLILFELATAPEALQQFAGILESMIEQVESLTRMIWDLGNQQALQESMVRISDLENRADSLHNAVTVELFRDDGLSPIDIMKWREVYQGLEDACDECKDFTHIIGNIVTKSA